MSEHLRAEPYERTEERKGYRSGYKPRVFTTRVGDLELLIPQDRDGTFSTTLFERYQRSEKALCITLMEMYVKGVSTRKVKDITEKLCGRSFSAQTVSNLAKGFDERIEEWKSRPLDGSYPYLIVDALYEKIRSGGRVTSKAVLIVLGINRDGYREVLDVRIADTENEVTWSELFRDLKRRGLKGVELLVSDNHEGIKRAVERYFQGASWQRSQAHFIRNLLSLASKGEKKEIGTDLRWIFDSPDIDTAQDRLREVVEKWAEKKPQIAEKIEEEIIDCLAVFHFPSSHRKRIRTTNALERLNEEIRRRTRVIRIFPNEASCLRLVASLAIEQTEEWERKYLGMELLEEWRKEKDTFQCLKEEELTPVLN